MSQGIFISYSREDQKQALALLNMLRKEGYDVWIDQEAIPGASIWSDEIVQNIKSCDIFLALLSESSVSSPNVAKEIGLAAEHGKTILPIEIGVFELPGRLEYALAGIQKTDYHNEEAILHAIQRQTAKPDELPQIHKHRKTRRQRIRQRVFIGSALAFSIAAVFFLTRNSSEKAIINNAVIVLPFSTMNLDQDSTHNLDIFSERILARVSIIPTLKAIGPSVSVRYKDSKLNSLAIARELDTRYIVEGVVRKRDNVNFISVRIFDLKKAGEVWEEFYSGNINELFSVREKISDDVTGYLRNASEGEQAVMVMEQKIASQPNDPKLYAQLANHLLGSDNVRSLDLFHKAIKLDSNNVTYYIQAGIVADRQKDGGLANSFGNAGIRHAKELLKAHPDSTPLIISYTIALGLTNQNETAEKIYDSLIHIYPKDVRLLYNYACCYAKQGKADQAINILEKIPGKRREVRSDPDFDNIRMYPRYIKYMTESVTP
jgi:TolB-like protein